MATASDGNGGPKTKVEIERRDLLKVAGFVLGLVGLTLGAVVPLSMYVFQTRADALIEHAAIDRAAALHAQEAALRREFGEREVGDIKTDVADTKAIVRTVHANQRAFMHDMGVRRAKPLPASVDFSDLVGPE